MQRIIVHAHVSLYMHTRIIVHAHTYHCTCAHYTATRYAHMLHASYLVARSLPSISATTLHVYDIVMWHGAYLMHRCSHIRPSPERHDTIHTLCARVHAPQCLAYVLFNRFL